MKTNLILFAVAVLVTASACDHDNGSQAPVPAPVNSQYPYGTGGPNGGRYNLANGQSVSAVVRTCAAPNAVAQEVTVAVTCVGSVDDAVGFGWNARRISGISLLPGSRAFVSQQSLRCNGRPRSRSGDRRNRVPIAVRQLRDDQSIQLWVDVAGQGSAPVTILCQSDLRDRMSNGAFQPDGFTIYGHSNIIVEDEQGGATLVGCD